MGRTKSAKSLESRLKEQIVAAGRGAVFTPSRFLEFGSRAAVDKALSRLLAGGTIRRLGRGVYDYPRIHRELGPLAPAVDAIAKALAGRDGIRLQPTGAYAANVLRLSEQVPMKVQFLTDGPARRVRVGRREIVLKRTTPRNMAAAGRTSGLVIQALRYLGKTHATLDRVKPLRDLLSAPDRKQLLADLSLAPAWMHPHLRLIAGEKLRV